YVLHEDTGLISRVNHAFTERFGYTSDDLPDAESQMVRFYPDPELRSAMADLWAEALERAAASDTTVQFPDVRICCRDGTYRDVQGFVSHAGNELVIGWVDFTEQRATQATLQQAEEIAKLGSFSHDFASNEIRTSPGFLEVLGFDSAVRDSHRDPSIPWLFNMFHLEDQAVMLSEFLRRGDVDATVRAVPDGGPQRYLRVRVGVVHDTTGHPLRAVGSVQDVTAEVTATIELRRYRDHLQELVDERTAELAKANATLQATDRRLKAMLAMSQKASTLGESAILQLGVDEAARLTGSPVGFLHLVTEDEERVEFAVWAAGTQEQGDCLYESHYDVGGAQTWTTAVRQRQPVVINTAVMSQLAACPQGHVPLRRCLVVPVLEGERVRMLLAVGNKDTDYDASDVQELQFIGHDVWSALSRRRADLALEQAYERVKASDQRFAFAMEASSEGVWEWDFVRDALTVNDPYATMLGFAPEEIPRSLAEWSQLIHPDERDEVMAAERRAALSDAPYATEFRMRSRDGSYRWILSRGQVVQRDAGGRALRIVGTHTDLTARRQAEDELRQAKEAADAASRAKSAFLATMSHEIRTPLNGVIAMAEVLGHSNLPPLDLDAVQTIQSSARALMSVIDDILDFSKIEAGRLDIDLADVSMVLLAEDLAESLLPLAHSREVDLLLFVEPEMPLRVRGDATRMRQIMYNLVGNAIKFSAGQPHRRGRVAIRIGSVSERPSHFYFEVADNGIGMSAETIGQLFTSFQQAEASTTRKFGGTGLGLAITKRLVDLMHGEIAVNSELGAGSTFRVTLPLTVVEATPALVPHDLSGLTCVIVEHEGGVPSGHLRRYLEFAHAQVEVVPDDATAADAAGRTDGLCIVIHDLNGQRVLESLPAFTDRPNVRHVALTRGRRYRERIRLPNVVAIDME
ncbi:MAG: sensor histidine kinase, partial [Gemmatimonadaceae bacterium]